MVFWYFQAFGNAKTAHNNNSSRFGKFIQVNYQESGTVRGWETHAIHQELQLNTMRLPLTCVYVTICRAYVEKYLLEKSRLVYQEHNERWARRSQAQSAGPPDLIRDDGYQSGLFTGYLCKHHPDAGPFSHRISTRRGGPGVTNMLLCFVGTTMSSITCWLEPVKRRGSPSTFSNLRNTTTSTRYIKPQKRRCHLWHPRPSKQRQDVSFTF